MNIVFTPELTEYIRRHRHTTLAVEFVELNNTDLEITELHPFFVNSRMREQFLKKGYRVVAAEPVEVLLPPYPLQLADTVTFGLKSFLLFKHVTYDGIKV